MAEGQSDYVKRADSFSYGSLKLTFDLIRKADPQLALIVRNINAGVPLPKDSSEVDNKNSNYFRVELDSFQVRAIVEILMQQEQEDIAGSSNPGMAIVAKALKEDWIDLARKMVAELPEDQRPS